MTFETIELFLAQLIVEHESNRIEFSLTATPLLPCAIHFPVYARFPPELFGIHNVPTYHN